MEKAFVEVNCGDPIDRSQYIPMDKVKRIEINLDGHDTIWTDDGEAYIPANNDSFYESVCVVDLDKIRR